MTVITAALMRQPKHVNNHVLVCLRRILPCFCMWRSCRWQQLLPEFRRVGIVHGTMKITVQCSVLASQLENIANSISVSAAWY